MQNFPEYIEFGIYVDIPTQIERKRKIVEVYIPKTVKQKVFHIFNQKSTESFVWKGIVVKHKHTKAGSCLQCVEHTESFSKVLHHYLLYFHNFQN